MHKVHSDVLCDVQMETVMNAKNQNVMPLLRKIARIEDKATGLFIEEIEFPVSQTETRRLQLSASEINDLSALYDNLLDHGAVLPTTLRKGRRSWRHLPNPLPTITSFMRRGAAGLSQP
jgi:hypothetical protein